MRKINDPEIQGIAIIGMACRVPGASDFHQFWRNLCNGVESVSLFSDAELLAAGVDPAELAQPNYVKKAFRVPDIDKFDAAFFEYSPREVRLMDPQHRLLLEVGWEAFEDAGYRPGRELGSVGVVIGTGGIVTSYVLNELSDHPEARGRTANLTHIGNDKDFASTRLSYKFDLVGPSYNVQTACSTSLIAVHLACQTILSGECSMALAGASTIRVPEISGYLSVKGGLYSPDGVVRTFDADARGTVFSSAIGVVLLKDLKSALADGDNIYAVIKATAVNNDGALKASYSGSSVAGQSGAMIQAVADSGIDPDTIGYVECHGTGTAVGDPIEIAALTETFRRQTSRTGFCPVGSVKPNIGHAEQAAGIVALIKTALAVQRGEIPATINLKTLNPKIDFDTSPFFVNTALRSWSDATGPRRALVNSLGIGGTNGVVILEQAPAPVRAKSLHPARPAHLFVLSAKSDAALTQTLARQRAALEAAPDTDLGDLAATLAVGRLAFPHRYSLVASNAGELIEKLAGAQIDTATDRKAAGKRRIGFLFTGQGAQFSGMGRDLYDSQPLFRATLDRCAAAMAEILERPLLEVMFAADPATAALIDQTAYTQPALFALQVSLATLLKDWGIVPAALVGHSVGEFALAVTAGVYSLDQAARLIATRAKLMQALPAGGAMAAIFADEATVRAALDRLGRADIDIAALNGPQGTVISGAGDAVDAVLADLDSQGITGRRLTVSHAFHAPLMAPAMGEFRAALADVAGATPQIPWISTLTGTAQTDAPGPDYWVDHAMRPVRFMAAVRELAAQGITDFIEIGPGKSMLSLAQTSLADHANPAGRVFLPTLGKDSTAGRDLLEAVGRLFCRGEKIDWARFDAPWPRRRLSLPTYPFQGERLWNERDGNAAPRAGRPAAAQAAGLVGTRLRSSLPEAQFDSVYGVKYMPWLEDHQVYGQIVLPTTAGLVALLGAGRRLAGDQPLTIANFTYRAPMFLTEAAPERITQIVLKPEDGAGYAARLVSADDPDGTSWQTHMLAALLPAGESGADAAGRFNPEAIIPGCQALDPAVYYAGLAKLGLPYGPSFRGITALWQGVGQAVARIRLPDSVVDLDAAAHPALLDACLHLYPAALDLWGGFAAPTLPPDGMHLPTGIERFALLTQNPVREAWVQVRRRLAVVTDGDDSVVVDIHVQGLDGTPLARFEGLSLKPLPAKAFQPAGASRVDWLYRMRWDTRAVAGAGAQAPTAWLILADRGGVGAALARDLSGRGQLCRVLDADAALGKEAGMIDSADALAHALTALAQESAGKRVGIVYLWGLDARFGEGKAASLEPMQQLVLGNALRLVQAVGAAREHFATPPQLWLVTRNAVAATDTAPPVELAQSGLWGFGRTTALEYPQLWGGLVDLEALPAAPGGNEIPADAARLAAHLLAGDGESQAALRGSRRLVARFVRAPVPDPRPPVAREATYLITGGLGALGVETARWLVEKRGVTHLVLASRRGEDDPSAPEIKAMFEAKGAQVTIAKLDTADEASVKKLMTKLRKAKPALRGIYHSAGLLDDQTIAQMDWPKFRRAVAPKFDGAWFLHKHSADIPLDDFVMYSSILSLFGAGGQVNYTSANAGLDGLAAWRRRQGLPALAINWGPWATAGLATLAGEQGEAIWKARGLLFIDQALGQEAFSALLDSGYDHAAVLPANWSAIIGQFATPPKLFAEMLAEAGAGAAAGGLSADIDSLKAKLGSADPGERRMAIVAFVGQQAMATLGVSKPIDPARPLRELGLDSLMAVTLINRIEMALSVRIPAVKLIKGPSIDELVDDVWPDLAGAALPVAAQLPTEAAPGAENPADQTPAAAPLSNLAAIIAAPTPVQQSSWLIPVGKRANPRARLFCFPFAGGGSAVFRAWANQIDPAIEVVAVEPPGRLSRIAEAPVHDMDEFVDAVLDEMIDLLDRPFALFGHCLGGVTMFETARTLIEETQFRPMHLFASGARAPDQVGQVGPFEKKLRDHLMRVPGYRADLQPYEQSDEIFADIIRQFEMAATDQFLDDPELRKLMLPAVRAEFEMTSNYRFVPGKPWDVPITCFVSRGDPYVSREDVLGWGRFTNQRLQVLMRTGSHYAVVEDAQFINRIINREMVMPI